MEKVNVNGSLLALMEKVENMTTPSTKVIKLFRIGCGVEEKGDNNGEDSYDKSNDLVLDC